MPHNVICLRTTDMDWQYNMLPNISLIEMREYYYLSITHEPSKINCIILIAILNCELKYAVLCIIVSTRI